MCRNLKQAFCIFVSCLNNLTNQPFFMKIPFNFFGFLFLTVLLAGCTGCQDSEAKKVAENIKKKEAAYEPPPTYDANVPDACSLLTTQEIASAMGVDANGISIKDGSNLRSLNVRSCFFRWEHDGVPNSGVLIQAQSNPLPDDFPAWVSTYIKSKIESGEKSMDGETFIYKPFNGGGIEGAYNHQQSKYFWRVDDKLIYSITFNMFKDEKTQLAWAEKIAAYVNN